MAVAAPAPVPPSPSGSAALSALLDTLPEAVVHVDAAGLVGFCNRAAMRLVGCEPGQGVAQLAAAFGRADRGWVEGVLRRRDAAAAEREATLADGRRVKLVVCGVERGWALRVALLAPAPGGAPRLPATAPESARELLRLLWRSPLPAALQDATWRLVDVNDAYVAFTGYPREQLIGRDPVELEPEVDRGSRRADRDRMEELLSAGSATPLLERRLLDARGHERWFRVTGHRIAVGADALMLSVLQDTTAEHVARAQADRSLDELAQWFDLSPSGMLVFDAAGLILRSNRAFEALVGRVPVVLGEADAEVQALLAWRGGAPDRALMPGAQALERLATVALPDGGRRRLSARLSAFATDSGQRRILAVVEDRSAEEERDRAEREIETLMDTAGVFVASYDPVRGWLTRGNARLASGAGAGQGNLHAVGRELVEPASLPAYEQLQSALRRGERAELRYAVRHPELGLRWLLTRVEPGALAGGGGTISVVTLDVTDRERAQRRNEQLLRELATILEGSPAGIAYVRGSRLVRCNGPFERMVGLPAGGGEGASLDALLTGQPQARAVLEAAQAAIVAGRPFEAELPGPGSPGAEWFSLRVRRADPGEAREGEPAEAVAVLTDVTRLKSQQAELEAARSTLESQAERTRAVLDSVLVGIVTVDDRGVEWMNRSARRMFGGELADFVGRPLDAVATADPDHPLRRTHYLHALAEGQAESFECRLQARDGRTFWVVGNAVRSAPEGGPAQVTFALLDIERRRQAEVRIAAAQASLQRVIETAPLALALVRSPGLEVLQANQTAARLLGRAGDDWPRLEPGRSALEAELAAWLAAPAGPSAGEAAAQRRELRQILPEGGGVRLWDARLVTVDAGDGTVQGLLVASDVTEQRAADEARLQAAIAQRERLVKEVHHRIKNNLQGVAGLLQQNARRHPEVAPMLDEAVGQVQAIAQVYGLQLGDVGALRLASVAEAIAAAVTRSLGRGPVVRVEDTPGLRGGLVHELRLPEAESIPIALSLNELFTNAVRHGADGELSCRIACLEGGAGRAAGVLLEVRSPGRLPADFDLARYPGGVSGLNLVRALLPRRSAVLTVEQAGESVLARIELRPPAVRWPDAAP